MMESLAATFRDESLELLGELESSLLELGDTPENTELIGQIFRALHTLKGSGAMAGFSEISAFAHEVETIFDEVRSGHIAVTPELINLTLAARDQIKAMSDAACGDGEVDPVESERIVRQLRRLCPVAGDVTGPARTVAKEAGDDAITYRIRFRVDPDIFCHGVNPVYLLRELQQLGECQVVAQVEGIPELDQLDPEQCFIWWDVILTTTRGKNAIEDVFIFVIDSCQLQVDVVDAPWIEAGDDKRLGEILMERGDLSLDTLIEVMAEHKKIGEILVEKQLATPGRVASALAEQKQVKMQRDARRERDAVNSIRVKSEKLDALVNLIGELVTVQARLSQTTQGANAELLLISEEVERLTWELRDQVLTIRMLPIGASYGKFRRLVHDLSQELGKNLQLLTEGAETELDKTVIERLSDPLIHLIRNCVDHGIESPDERRRRGKPAIGTVWLSAAHAGAHVIIQVRDDGSGIDLGAVRRKAEAAGLIAPGAEVSERDLLRTILAPGVSTAQQITEVSGRGVGMDVVKQAIEGLRGDLDITTLPGEGTTFTIKLPLTLAIIDGLLVKIGSENYILPLASIVECLEIRRRQEGGGVERNIVNVRGAIVPYVRLRDEFAIVDEAPEIEQVVIADIGGVQLGFVVDTVIGEHQTVIKNLGKLYKGVQGISGATILGDGRVALILDPQALLALAQERERNFLAMAG